MKTAKTIITEILNNYLAFVKAESVQNGLSLEWEEEIEFVLYVTKKQDFPALHTAYWHFITKEANWLRPLKETGILTPYTHEEWEEKFPPIQESVYLEHVLEIEPSIQKIAAKELIIADLKNYPSRTLQALAFVKILHSEWAALDALKPYLTEEDWYIVEMVAVIQAYRMQPIVLAVATAKYQALDIENMSLFYQLDLVKGLLGYAPWSYYPFID